MSRKLIGLVLLLLVLPTIGFAQERYLIGYAGFAGFQVSMWAVQDLGLLKKYGLEGDVILVPGTTPQIQALVAFSSLTWTRPDTCAPSWAEPIL